jgi:uncharacterized protein (TIGR03067 family)
MFAQNLTMKTNHCRLPFGVLLAVLNLALSASAADDTAERAKLTGTWEGWVVEGDGSQTAQRRQRVNELVINAAQISAKDGRSISMGQGTYKLGGAGGAKTIDATGTTGPTQGKFYLGIYRLDGDTLRWCSGNERARTRPTEFKTNTGNGHFLMILTRKKPAEKSAGSK